MAAIDKIYGTYDQWCELHQWVAWSKRHQYCRYFYPTPNCNLNTEGPIMNNPINVDMWLYYTCPLIWVKSRIKEMYSKDFLRKYKKSARL